MNKEPMTIYVVENQPSFITDDKEAALNRFQADLEDRMPVRVVAVRSDGEQGIEVTVLVDDEVYWPHR